MSELSTNNPEETEAERQHEAEIKKLAELADKFGFRGKVGEVEKNRGEYLRATQEIKRSTGEIPIAVIKEITELGLDLKNQGVITNIHQVYDVLHFMQRYVKKEHPIKAVVKLLTESATFKVLKLFEQLQSLSDSETIKPKLAEFWPRLLGRTDFFYSNLDTLPKDQDIVDHEILSQAGAFPFNLEITENGKEILESVQPETFATRLAFRRLKEILIVPNPDNEDLPSSERSDLPPGLGKTHVLLNPLDRLPSFWQLMIPDHEQLSDRELLLRKLELVNVGLVLQVGTRRTKIMVPARVIFENNYQGFLDSVQERFNDANAWQELSVDKATIEKAYRGKQSLRDREKARRDSDNILAADIAVVIAQDDDISLNTLKNNPAFITTEGIQEAYFVSTNKQNKIADLGAIINHHGADGAQKYADIDKLANETIGEFENLDTVDPEENKRQRKLRFKVEDPEIFNQNIKNAELSKNYTQYHQIDVATIEGNLYSYLIQSQEKIFNVFKRLGYKCDLATIIHLVAMIATKKDNAQFLDLDKSSDNPETYTPATAISVLNDELSAKILADSYKSTDETIPLNEKEEEQLFIALRLLEHDRKSVQSGFGITKVFDLVTRKTRGLLSFFGQISDRFKKEVLTKSGFMSSFLITRTPYLTAIGKTRQPENTYAKISDFSTAHFNQVDGLVVAGQHGEGKITVSFDHKVNKKRRTQLESNSYDTIFLQVLEELVAKLVKIADAQE